MGFKQVGWYYLLYSLMSKSEFCSSLFILIDWSEENEGFPVYL